MYQSIISISYILRSAHEWGVCLCVNIYFCSFAFIDNNEVQILLCYIPIIKISIHSNKSLLLRAKIWIEMSIDIILWKNKKIPKFVSFGKRQKCEHCQHSKCNYEFKSLIQYIALSICAIFLKVKYHYSLKAVHLLVIQK